MPKIKVLVIDDSAVARKVLTEILSSDPEIEVIGTAADPFIARSKIKELNPDVLTLDIEMPRMDGITFLRNLMRLRPMPVVMISTLTEKGAAITFEALEIGAVDFVSKPRQDLANQLAHYAEQIILKVKMAARANIRAKADRVDAGPPEHRPPACRVMTKSPEISAGSRPSRRVVAIGASTGGTEAIKEVLTRLPENFPGIVIAQHIPAGFSTSFAERMNRLSKMTVHEPTRTMSIQDGHVYIAPGDRHLKVRPGQGGGFECYLEDGPAVNRHKPSVDVLFDSVAVHVGKKAYGVILTGMGADGARGLKAMKEAGAYTIAQNEATSVVWGMPGEAVKRGAVDEQLALEAIAQQLVDKLEV
ncbi:MAG: chemotaxis response regulator protein-glutamate methylesterase [Gammaproteobacteria bacterium]